MKKLLALLTALVVLAPTFALAHEGEAGVETHANASAEVHGGPGKPLPTPSSIKATVQMRADANASTSPNRGPGSSNSGPGKLGAGIRAMASTTREMFRQKLDTLHDLIESHRMEMQERAQSAREKAKEHFGERIEKLVGNVSDRLASTSAKLSGIADRIDARIDVLADQGHDMSGSLTLLATSRADIAAANDKIAAANVALDAAMSQGTTTAKAEIPAVRAAVKAAEDALMLAKQDLVKTLQSVKAEGGADAEATTTLSH